MFLKDREQSTQEEPRPSKSIETMAQPEIKHKGCLFCEELDPVGRVSLFHRLFPEFINQKQILFQTDDFNVIPDLGAITQNHVLIVPKKHETAFARLPVAYSSQLFIACSTIKEKVNAQSFFMFEHGSGSLEGELTACGNSIYHAHLHVLPLPKDLGISLLDRTVNYAKQAGDFSLHSVTFGSERDIISVLREVTHGYPYLLMKQDRRGFVLVEDKQMNVPSQFLRRVAAEVLEGRIAFWDWKSMNQSDRDIVVKRLKSTYNSWM